MSATAVNPISPEEAKASTIRSIPAEVIEAFNAEISTRLSPGGEATVFIASAVKRLNDAGFDTSEAFANRWFDVESVFQEAGWEVQYNQPGCYDLSVRAHFTFKKQ